MEVIFYIAMVSGFIVVYHHAIYPLLLRLCADKKTEEQPKADVDDNDLPSVHLILPAYNEADVIAQKIRNVAQIDYPKDKLKITLVGDGCTDETIAIARATMAELDCRELPLLIDEHLANRGKIAVLNQAISQSDGDIIALSDISAMISCDAFRLAARHFQEAKVGVVNSSYQFANYSSEGEKTYWLYQSKVKQMESRTGSVIGAHGALYFFRRLLFTELNSDTINDDFILPMEIVAKGYKAVHDETIVATELECVKADNNNIRRKRIAAGNLQQAIRLKRLLLPKFKGVAFNFLSGKVLRVLTPLCLILLLCSSFILAGTYWFFMMLALGQFLFYGLALFQHSKRNQQQSNRLLGVIYYFSAGHWFSFVGMVEYLSKKRTFKV
jgi:cellulose synthase/poly-beta-1,6-N-acetylglucosamine synthase-like glycosyltransferase